MESIYPPRPLVILGAGFDVVPLVAAAKAVGWHVTVVDPRAASIPGDRFALADSVVAGPFGASAMDERTAVVIMAHHFLTDLASLRSALESRAGYIGLLGPARRGQRLLDDLGSSLSEDDLARVYSPIGLDVGAEGPDEVALAVVAEIQAAFAARPGGFLRGLSVPLHETCGSR